jgi:hypothetical protein
MKTFLKITLISLMISCQSRSKQVINSNPNIDTSRDHYEMNNLFEQDSSPNNLNKQENSSESFIAILKEGLDNINASINDSTTFIAHKGQLILYFSDPHTAFIADGRYGYIPPENLVEIDTPYFKFNFTSRSFIYAKDYELFQTAKTHGNDLNKLVKNIQQKDTTALLQFFELKDVVDGASAEEFYELFWVLINLWTDDELSSFIMTLNQNHKKDFCTTLIESSYCDPFKYYMLYYPLTLNQIELTK